MNLTAYIPLFPLVGFLINGLAAKRLRFSETAIGSIACTMIALSFVCSVVAVLDYYSFAKNPTTQALFLKKEAALIERARGPKDDVTEVRSAAPEHGHAGTEAVATPYVQTVFTWIPGGGALRSLGPAKNKENAELTIEWAYQLDQLSGLYVLFVTFVGFLIHVFAVGYMHGEAGFARFFAYLNLFMFMMLTLVLGANFVMMFVGWEGVGLCSFLLIGYYFQKKEAGDASKKAFVVNRIGDFGLMLGMMGVFAVFGTLNFHEVMPMAKALSVEPLGLSSFSLTTGVLTLITLALFVGAVGKSAQIPLFIWLPDAMAGPTPVSALIHAATMVTAGVYMVARCNPLFHRAPTTMLIMALVGCATAFVAATIGLTQTDIKKVLAYSTVSQLGFMFLGCGVGAVTAGVFHVVTHAFFKAQLFLGAGSVIHGGSPSGHEQELSRFGNFRAYMPTTYKTMLMSLFAICGIVPFAGFFSKDEILAQTLHTSVLGGAWGTGLYAVGFLTAGVTAFYMTRLMCLTFFGSDRWKEAPAHHSHENEDDADDVHQHHGHGTFHPHESPLVMRLPLIILAFFAVTAGFFGVAEELTGGAVPNLIHHWLAPMIDVAGKPHEAVHFEPMAWVLGLASCGWALAMMYAAWHCYVTKPEVPAALAERFQALYQLSFRKWYWDELLDGHLVEGIKRLNQGLWDTDAHLVDGGVNGTAWLARTSSVVMSWIDRWVVDALVNFMAWLTRLGSLTIRQMQNGTAQTYLLVMVLGLAALLYPIEAQFFSGFFEWVQQKMTNR
ncbi:MAG: NADH-quinone oxidoreductase subunit L [Blastocatellia bacterium]|nr:NADH-quinone oxidoreductase subunit L [Blastocatellia bacterium]